MEFIVEYQPTGRAVRTLNGDHIRVVLTKQWAFTADKCGNTLMYESHDGSSGSQRWANKVKPLNVNDKRKNMCE